MVLIRFHIAALAIFIGISSARSLSISPSSALNRRRCTGQPWWSTLRGGEQLQSPGDDTEGIHVADTTESENTSTIQEKLQIAVLPFTSAVGSLGRFYYKQLGQRPVLTKSVTAGLIFGLSDYLAQNIEKSKSEESDLDLTRIIASILVGFLYFGPAAHYWYEMIFRLLPGTSLLSTMQKAMWGQLVFGPSFTCIFFASSLLQSGDFSINKWLAKIRSDLPGAWLAGAGYWPLVDLISYSVIPIIWIPLFVNLCSLIWTVYLSLVANKK